MITFARIAFWMHTALCGVFIVWVGSVVVSSFNEGFAALLPRTVKVGGMAVPGDESIVNGLMYVILGLFLLYAQVYLYRIYVVATAFSS